MKLLPVPVEEFGIQFRITFFLKKKVMGALEWQILHISVWYKTVSQWAIEQLFRIVALKPLRGIFRADDFPATWSLCQLIINKIPTLPTELT